MATDYDALIKEKKGMVTAYENRLNAVKDNVEKLNLTKVELESEINGKREAFKQEIEQKYSKLRAEAETVQQSIQKMREERIELDKVNLESRRLKNEVERDQSRLNDMKANYEAMTKKVGEFVLLIRREAEKL